MTSAPCPWYILLTRLALLLPLWAAGLGALSAQPTGGLFTDQLRFPEDLARAAGAQLTDADEEFLEGFEEYWATDSATLTRAFRRQCLEIARLLHSRTTHNRRHLITFARIIWEHRANDKLRREWDVWAEGLTLHASDPQLPFGWLHQFLDNSLGLFAQGTLFTNPAFRWRVRGGSFRLELDTTLTIHFANVTLSCQNETDSMVIASTSGVFHPTRRLWMGHGGLVTWARSELPTDAVFAELAGYQIHLEQNGYTAHSVRFTNRDYLTTPALGRLTDKLVRAARPENVFYPEFEAYGERIRIPNLFRNVDYYGSFRMVGNRFMGQGTPEHPAYLYISRNGEEFLRIGATTFVFRRQTVVSDLASARFRIGYDSMYHTGMGFFYNDQVREVALAPTQLLSTQSPMTSSYHNLSIGFTQLRWNIDSDTLTLGPPKGGTHGRAQFESINFFNEVAFDNLMGPDERHPLWAIRSFTRRVDRTAFYAREFARYMRKSVEQTRIQLMRMAMLGYILYDAETTRAQVLPKLTNALRARDRRIDYDVIRFNSTSTNREPNAILNLNSLEMHVRGVDRIAVSDSQNVFIHPARQQVILKRNRNFEFDGVIRTGLFTFFGNRFNFDYETFTFNLKAIDSLHLAYQTDRVDLEGNRILRRVTSTLELTSGVIHIDEPDNKSGLRATPDYPIFRSTSSSFVYYDHPSIHNGVYQRENFYFEIFPFEFKQMNSFEREDIVFKGVFYSADIFPPLEDTLVLRPDESLGLRRTFAEPFPIYQGKGLFTNRIDLSNQGLRANGTINYITTTTQSDDFFFFPDSMRTLSTAFSMAQQDRGIQYPQVEGQQHLVEWHPYRDRMTVQQGAEPFELFHGQAQLRGNLVIDPLGLTADGQMALDNARLRSRHYAFNALDFRADTATLEMRVPGSELLSLRSDRLRAHVDLQARRGTFSKLGHSLFAQLDALEYHAHLDRMIWDMDHHELTMATPAHQQAVELGQFQVRGMAPLDSIPPGSLFYSVRHAEDSLHFFSPIARYNVAKPHLTADSVAHLLVADAMIFPYRQRVEVDAQQRLLPLSNSRILANLTSRYHRIHSASIAIPSRRQYTARGIIDYIDERDSIQPVALTEIRVDKQGHTVASGAIAPADSFYLSPNFRFEGSVNLSASRKHWDHRGAVKMVHPCHTPTAWMRFAATIDPRNIMIPLPERPQTPHDQFLMSGSVISSDSLHLYPGMLTPRVHFADRSLVASHGYLTFNHRNNRFQIGSPAKMANPDTLGNLIGLSRDLCMIFSEGAVTIPVNLGQLRVQAHGGVVHELADSTLQMELVLTLDFLFSDLALNQMVQEIMALPELSPTSLNHRHWAQALHSRCSPADAAQALQQIRLFGALTQIPRGLESTITLSELRMRWDPVSRTFVSYGPLGIGSIGPHPVNRRVNGFLEIIKRSAGDWLMLYLEPAPGIYYTFYYNRGTMQVSSHSPAFTDPIDALRERHRRIRVRPGEIPYNYLVGTRRERNLVKARYAELTAPPPEAAPPMEEDGRGSEGEGEGEGAAAPPGGPSPAAPLPQEE